jgi:hypothetical protein
MAANVNARSAGGVCPLNYVCACFAGNVSRPAKVPDGDYTDEWIASGSPANWTHPQRSGVLPLTAS